MWSRNKVNDPVYLTVDQVGSLFLSPEEIGSGEPLLVELASAFHALKQGHEELTQLLDLAKTTKGEVCRDGVANGLIWQRDRAFLISLVRVERRMKLLRQELATLKDADGKLRSQPSFAATSEQTTLIYSNLRCCAEMYEHAALLYFEVALFVERARDGAWTFGRAGIEFIRLEPPGFHRRWVVKFATLNGTPRYATADGEVSETPPDGPYMSGEIDHALELVAKRHLAKATGWVAVYDPSRDHTGPQHIYRNGVRLKEESK